MVTWFMPIHDWPEGERPRERLLAQGASALTDAELLAILLRTGTSGRSAVAVARDLLGEFGGLRTLFNAEAPRLASCRGIGPARTTTLKAVLELGRRALGESLLRGAALVSPRDTQDYLRATLGDRREEVFCAVFLDNRHRVIAFEELFRGTLDGTAVYPREVVRRALAHNAAAVIFAHNHPSGVAEPSRADEHLTRRLKDALTLLDIRVLDHLIIGDGLAVSFAERGLL